MNEPKTAEPLYIGIDPDVEKFGFAVWHRPLQKFASVESLTLVDLMKKLDDLRDNIALVVVEAGWLNKSNWHLSYVPKKAKIRNPLKYAAEAGEKTGRNQQRGMDIVEILEFMRIPYRLQRPMKPNTWKNDADMFKKMTGWEKRTNPESRDAAMLIYKS